jgi:hypothetical protein
MAGATERRRYQRGEKAGVTARGDYESKAFEVTKRFKKGKELSFSKIKHTTPFGEEPEYRLTFKKKF